MPAIPRPTRNISTPLRNTPRAVKMLRAAPTPKWASMLMMNAVQMAAGPRNRMKGSTGMKAPPAAEGPLIRPPGDQDDVVWHAGAQYPHPQAEVGGQPVVEPIDRVAQKSTGLDAVPGFSGSP